MRYYDAKWNKNLENKRYRVYITDALKAQAEGARMSERWIDTINKKVETRTGDEIVLEVFNQAGLKFKKD